LWSKAKNERYTFNTMKKSNMKYIFLAFTLLASTAYACNQTESSAKAYEANGISFHDLSVKDAVALAKKENKLVFIDAYTTWCGPCKRMSKYTFTNNDVAAFFNENFVNLKVDMEKSEGAKIESKFDIRNYPTLLFLDGQGNLVKKYIGYHTADQFLKVGKKMLKKKS
jgi:thioredoxin 1